MVERQSTVTAIARQVSYVVDMNKESPKIFISSTYYVNSIVEEQSKHICILNKKPVKWSARRNAVSLNLKM